MLVKTSDLTGPALDWVVVKADGVTNIEYVWPRLRNYSPSTDWSQGGPIIERERITVEFQRWDNVDSALPVWLATRKRHSVYEAEGFSPLIAAMRCYVASKLGDEVEVPDTLR